MSVLVDSIPALAFFFAWGAYDIYVATAVLIASTLLLAVGLWIHRRVFPKVPFAVATVVTVLGSLTLILHDPSFIRMKPTLIYSAFALALLGSHFIGDKVIIARLMDKAIALPAPIWPRLNAAWIVFYLVLAVVNYYIATRYGDATWGPVSAFGKTFTPSVWGTFKALSFSVIPLVFIMGQFAFIARYIDDPETRPDAR